jgi:flagellin
MLAIKNNIMAANAARYLGRSYDALATSVERLSSGLRINSAKDDAAGMAVRELMRADIAVLEQGVRNAQDGVSMLQTMEGAMATIDNCLVRMKQLAEQASTGSYSSAQRTIMNNEFTEMAAEIERIANTTKFNDIGMLDNTTARSIRFGTATDDAITASGADMTKAGLGITTGSAGYQLVSDTGAATADTDWVTVSGGTTDIVITFSDGGVAEDAITVTLSSAHGGDGAYTMNEIADLINAETQNLGNDADGVSKNYAMASVALGNDADNGRLDTQYYLTLTSRLTGADAVTMTSDLSADAAAMTGGWEDDATAGHAASSLTEAIDEGTANDGLMGMQAGTGINLLTVSAAEDALAAITTAIGLKDTARAAFGYKINRLEATGEVLAIQQENLSAAESRISDVDVATEMAELTRNQVLAQAGTAMLAQANSIPQMALSLLR